jgi:hypothetical protein
MLKRNWTMSVLSILPRWSVNPLLGLPDAPLEGALKFGDLSLKGNELVTLGTGDGPFLQ